MVIHDHLSSYPDDGTCDLYVHLKPAHALQNIGPVISWLYSEFSAISIFPNSFYISADNLYVEDNVDSFMADLTDFLGMDYIGLQVVICPTKDLHQLFCEPSDSEPEV